jgi:hypothetical protein
MLVEAGMALPILNNRTVSGQSAVRPTAILSQITQETNMNHHPIRIILALSLLTLWLAGCGLR